MADAGFLARTPYFFVARRPYRQGRLTAYIRREHRRGRHFSDILEDPYVARCGSREFVWATLRDTNLLELLDADCRDAIQSEIDALSK